MAKTSKGGSAFSLFHLIKSLDYNRYTPIVLLSAQNHSYTWNGLAELDVEAITLKRPQRTRSPVSLGPGRHRDIARWLKNSCGEWASQLYVMLKFYYQFVCQDVPSIWPIVRIIKEKEIDLVHLNNGLCHNRPEIIAARIAGVPCVCHVRMFEKLNYLDRILASTVAAFVFISSAVAKHLIAQGAPPTKGTVIHNAVDVDAFELVNDDTSVRKEFGWTAEDRVAGIIGRLDWWKGHEYFLGAMARVLQRIPHLKGLIVGEPEITPLGQEYFQKLQLLTKSLGLEDKVIFTGFRKDIPRLMSALDVVVLSSSSPEPFGRVVIEGMAAGKPVVATAAGGVLDIIENGVNGLLVPCKDSEALARAIFQILSDPELSRQMGQAARQRVKEKFTIQHHVAAIQQLYNMILDDSRHT